MSQQADAINDSFIEDNLLKCLGTPYFVQTLFGSARVNIKNNAVTNISTRQIAYTFLWIVLVTFSCCIFQYSFYEAFFYKNMLMYLSCSVGNGMQNIFYILCVLANRFSRREKNTKIYSMLQKIDRTLGIKNSTYYTDFQYRRNVIVIIMITVGFFIGYAANAIAVTENPIFTIFFAFGLLSMFMDDCIADAMIYFLAVRAKIFNTIIENHINKYRGNLRKKQKARTIKKLLFSLAFPEIQAPDKLDLSSAKWLQLLQDLLKSYKIITEIFSFTIFTTTVTSLIWSFDVIAAIVVGYRTGLYPLIATITIGMWAGFYHVQLISAAVVNDWFKQQIRKMKLLCIELISCDYDGPYRKTASGMIKMIHYDSPVFHVYGLFVLDKHLTIQIIGIIASNVIIIVQYFR